MNITVILCTYNRCQSLVKALDSAAALQLPRSVEWEVLVVDNNSTDKTCEVAQDFIRRHPDRFRYLFEPKPGKSHALNAGIRDAHAEILAFMDDDVLVEPSWLHNLTSKLKDELWAGAGGPILPLWTCPPPRWLSLESAYGQVPLVMFERGSEARELFEPPWGTNMAYRKSMFEKYGGFRTDLGPSPGSEIRAEDTEFGSRLLRAGERLWYEPQAIVHHPVPDNRLNESYFLAWHFAKGSADVRAVGENPAAKWNLCGIPLHLLRRVAMATLRWVLAIRQPRRFTNKLKTWAMAGRIAESSRHWVTSKRNRIRTIGWSGN
jgi:glucosyl-dolichyl phosphate glucuronosyltransferase